MAREDVGHILGHNARSAAFMAEFRAELVKMGYRICPHGEYCFHAADGEIIRRHYSKKYLPPEAKIRAIFQDKDHAERIEDFNEYDTRDRRILYRLSTKYLDNKENTMNLPSDKTLCDKYNVTQEQVENMKANNQLERFVKEREHAKARAEKRRKAKELKEQSQKVIPPDVIPKTSPFVRIDRSEVLRNLEVSIRSLKISRDTILSVFAPYLTWQEVERLNNIHLTNNVAFYNEMLERRTTVEGMEDALKQAMAWKKYVNKPGFDMSVYIPPEHDFDNGYRDRVLDELKSKLDRLCQNISGTIERRKIIA
jgi:hypothetical protein